MPGSPWRVESYIAVTATLYRDFTSKPCGAGERLSDTFHQFMSPTQLQAASTTCIPSSGHTPPHTRIFTHSANSKWSMNTSLLHLFSNFILLKFLTSQSIHQLLLCITWGDHFTLSTSQGPVWALIPRNSE